MAEVAATGVTATGATAGTVDRANLRVQKLKLTDDGRPATRAELGDERAHLTKNERLKIEKPGPKVWQDVLENYSQNGFAAISEDDMERFKWLGVYQQKPKDGYFMMRVKIAGGQLNNAQLRAISAVARNFADGIGDITTRQTIQIHWLTIENMPAVMDVLGEVNLGVKHELFGACGDICRNIVSSPLTGIDPRDVLDPTPFFQEATKYFSSNLEYADLPRKYKAAIVGNPDGAQCEINDISFYGVKRSDGRVGYGLMVGGGLSTEPHLAQDLSVFVAPEDGMAVMEAVTRIFRDHGYRKSRKHARFKYLVADWGAAKVRAEVESLLGRKLEDAESVPQNVRGYQDIYGVHPQKQEGLSFIGVPVVTGRLHSDQLDEIANIAQELGSGDVRLTVMQSLYIPNVPNEKTAEAVSRLAAIGLPVEVSAVRGGVVACTGTQYCNLAVTETKQRAKDLVNLLDNGVKWSDSEFFRINVNGCPNSCGQHWIADVGLQGCTKKIDGVLVEHYDVFLGGALGSNARFNRRIKRVKADDLDTTLQRVMAHYQHQKRGNESFAEFVARHSDEELEAIL
jgi:sulfite reductase beta subunit-like hemoprotein